MSVLFIRWMLQQEAEQQAKEAEEYGNQKAEDGAGII
jgi:hypothetical protein